MAGAPFTDLCQLPPCRSQAAVTSEAGEEDEDDEHWFEARGSNLWLLPVMRQHLCGARLAFFAQHFLPLAKQVRLCGLAGKCSGMPHISFLSQSRSFDFDLQGLD